MLSGKKELLEQLDVMRELAEENVCRMDDSLLRGLADGLRAVVNKQYARGISREDVARYLGISTRTLERWQKEHADFPKARHFGDKSVSYDVDEVIKWRKKHIHK